MRNNAELTAFFESNRKKLFGYLVKMTGSPDEAEDIFQDTFIKYAKTYPDRHSSALLFTVAKSIFLDGLKKQSRNTELGDMDIEDDNNPENVIIGRASKQRVFDLMDKLSGEERELLSMAGSDGMSYDEIAEIKKMSKANVKVKIFRARKRLKEMMEAENE
ncbi:MAG: RNA polymerase sigma factor [Deferribacterales bacterium]